MAQKTKTKPKSRRDDPEQSKLFIAKAREIGADGSRSVADKLVGHLAKLPPQPKLKSK
jgi:hypothetical protein